MNLFVSRNQRSSRGGDILFIPHRFSTGVNVSGTHAASMFLRAVFKTSIFWRAGGKPATAFSSFVATWKQSE